jgi:hypothetical protein
VKLTEHELALLSAVWSEVFDAEPSVEYFVGDEKIRPAVWVDETVAFTSTPGNGRYAVAVIGCTEEGDITYLDTTMASFDLWREAVAYAAGAMARALAEDAGHEHEQADEAHRLASAGLLNLHSWGAA